jgi:transposase
MSYTKLQRFDGETMYVGIDTHLKSWKVSIHSKEFELKTFTQPPDAKKLMNYLTHHFPGANYECVYEAGFSGFSAQRQLIKLGANCIVAHPADVPTTDKEKKNKNDRRDSRKLARGLKNGDLNPIHIPDEEREQDRALLRTRDRIIRNKSRVKNRIKFLLMYLGKAIPEAFQGKVWSNRFIAWLTEIDLSPSTRTALDIYLEELQSLVKMEKKINKQIKILAKKPRYAENLRLLMSIPSIGVISAMILLTEIGDIRRFKKFKSLCCYFGLVPNLRNSGETTHVGRMTKRGNTYLKYILIECAWTAMRKDPALLMYYKSIVVHTEPNKAIVKVARKLLNRIRAILTEKTEYVTGVVQ